MDLKGILSVNWALEGSNYSMGKPLCYGTPFFLFLLNEFFFLNPVLVFIVLCSADAGNAEVSQGLINKIYGDGIHFATPISSLRTNELHLVISSFPCFYVFLWPTFLLMRLKSRVYYSKTNHLN